MFFMVGMRGYVVLVFKCGMGLTIFEIVLLIFNNKNCRNNLGLKWFLEVFKRFSEFDWPKVFSYD